jgi:hypothetical protein
VRGVSRLDHRRKAFQQRIERPRITGEIAADEMIEAGPSPKLMQNGFLAAAATSKTSGMADRHAALLDMM